MLLFAWMLLQGTFISAQTFNKMERCELNLDSTIWELTGMDDYQNELIWEYALRAEIKGKYTQVIRLTVTPYRDSYNTTPNGWYNRAVKNLNQECPDITENEILAKGTKAIIFKTVYKDRCGRQKPGVAYTRMFAGQFNYQYMNFYEINYFFIGITPTEEMLDKAGEILTGAYITKK